MVTLPALIHGGLALLGLCFTVAMFVDVWRSWCNRERDWRSR